MHEYYTETCNVTIGLKILQLSFDRIRIKLLFYNIFLAMSFNDCRVSWELLKFVVWTDTLIYLDDMLVDRHRFVDFEVEDVRARLIGDLQRILEAG